MEKNEQSKAKSKMQPTPMNLDVLKGVWVDGIGLGVSYDCVILDGFINPPRADKPYVVSRMMFPPRMLEHLAKSLSKAVEEQKKLKAPEVRTEGL